MKRTLFLFFIPITFWGCVREELIENVDNPEAVYERLRTKFNRRVSLIDELHCLGEMYCTGASKFYVTFEYDSQGGMIEFFSPLRQKLGWVYFNPDTTTYSFEESPELSDLADYGLLLGWSLVGYPPFPVDVQRLKVGESRHSFYVGARSKNILYYFRVLKSPMVVQSMKIKKGEFIIEANFKAHRKEGNHFFPYLINGSTPLGDFELRYLEIKQQVSGLDRLK